MGISEIREPKDLGEDMRLLSYNDDGFKMGRKEVHHRISLGRVLAYGSITRGKPKPYLQALSKVLSSLLNKKPQKD